MLPSRRIRADLALGLWLSLGLVWLAGCGGGDDNPAGPQSGWQTIATETIAPAGGQIGGEEISVSFPPGALRTAAVLTLSAVAATEHPLLDPRIETVGRVYRLRGLPAFADSLTLRLSVAPSLLPAGDSCLVYVEEEAFVSVDPGNGVRGRPLASSVVDRAAGVITATLPGDRSYAGDAVAAPQVEATGDLIITLTTFRGFQATTQGSRFVVCFDSRGVPSAWIAALLDALEDAQQHLEGLGFVFGNSPGDQIEVQVLDLPGGRNGEFVQSKWGIDASYLVIDPAISGPLLRATAAHELFHLVQMGYGASGHALGYDYLWISEASSVWFEPIFLGDDAWVPNVQEDNRNFVLQALETDDPDHGYGASRFLTHITEAYGDTTLVKLYRHIARQTQGSRSGAGAVAAALAEHDATVAETFTQFAQHYLTVATGHAGWGVPDAAAGLLTPDDTELDFTLSLPALAAWHANVRPDWGGADPPAGTLVVTLQGTPSPFVEGFIYTAPIGSGPWTLRGSIDAESHTFTLADYGRGQRLWTKVVLVNQRATYPYNQTESVAVDLVFMPADEFTFDQGFFSMRYHALTLDGSDRPRQGLLGGPHRGTLAGDTFTASWDSTNTAGDVQFSGELVLTVNATRTEITSWSWWYRWGFPALDVWHYYTATGGVIPQTYEGADYRQFSLLGAAMCASTTHIYWDVKEGGEVTEGLRSWSCNAESYLDFYLSTAD